MRECGAPARGDDGLEGHGLSSQQASLVLKLGGYLKLCQAGPDKAENVLEELATGERGLNHQRQLVFIFNLAQRHNQRRGERGEKTAAKAGGQRSTIAGKVGDGGLSWVEAGKLDAGLRGKPLHSGYRRRAFDDFNLCGGNLGCGLRCVAAIGKEARRTAR